MIPLSITPIILGSTLHDDRKLALLETVDSIDEINTLGERDLSDLLVALTDAMSLLSQWNEANEATLESVTEQRRKKVEDARQQIAEFDKKAVAEILQVTEEAINELGRIDSEVASSEEQIRKASEAEKIRGLMAKIRNKK